MATRGDTRWHVVTQGDTHTPRHLNFASGKRFSQSRLSPLVFMTLRLYPAFEDRLGLFWGFLRGWNTSRPLCWSTAGLRAKSTEKPSVIVTSGEFSCVSCVAGVPSATITESAADLLSAAAAAAAAAAAFTCGCCSVASRSVNEREFQIDKTNCKEAIATKTHAQKKIIQKTNKQTKTSYYRFCSLIISTTTSSSSSIYLRLLFLQCSKQQCKRTKISNWQNKLQAVIAKKTHAKKNQTNKQTKTSYCRFCSLIISSSISIYVRLLFLQWNNQQRKRTQISNWQNKLQASIAKKRHTKKNKQTN